MRGISADAGGPVAPATAPTKISGPASYAEALKSDEAYRIAGMERMLTPALIIFGAIADANIAAAIRHAGTPNRLRPHIKTAKLKRVIRRYVDFGIHQCKCATTREFEVACAAGMRDVLIAYPMMGANAQRIQELKTRFPDVNVSVLVDDRKQIKQWDPSVDIFIDVNPGMDRTGISADQSEQALDLAHATLDSGRTFRGLHYYDGHLGSYEFEKRQMLATSGYEELARFASEIEAAGIDIGEVITSGSAVFMFACACAFRQELRFTVTPTSCR
jgi:D-serine deaminase-like pyridoxal phosphate-dependent protein